LGERYVCVHGHFYQPPRENAWLEAIEAQDSAHPYHDWNERITAECYEPNTVSRILDGQDRIVEIVNNYSRISFDVGPTLLGWMKDKAANVYRAILDADRESQRSFSGHGSAMAQPYNHMILPLANRRDKYTQIAWGIRDFEHHYGRRPEGMWLPETAVDLESLDIMAELGVRFTVLAPTQAQRVRRMAARQWQEVRPEAVDPTTAYRQRLSSGRSIAIFFYDGPISRAVAFERLLARGENFANRLIGGFSDDANAGRRWPQLVHIATDGETYGHHHRYGDMALAYALEYIQKNGLARLTNYGEYLGKYPPSHFAEIAENTSWSCGHGVERWQSNCGCSTGAHPGWSQAWRAPLRAALDWLRDELGPRYETKAAEYLKDPWAARNDYIQVIHDRSPESVGRFFSKNASRQLTREDQSTALRLLELQRHALLMYTSCGWFFDDLSGIETVQVIQYAGRALQLAQDLFGHPLETPFLDRLELAKSNVPDPANGRVLYEKLVKPAFVDWKELGAHYVVSSLFEPYADRARVYCYDVEREDHHLLESGKTKLVTGRARLTSVVTWETAVMSFGAVHFGDHYVNAGVREYRGEDAYQSLLQNVAEPFERGDLPQVIRVFDQHFGESNYSLRSLFRDEQRRILNRILSSTVESAEAAYRQLYEQYAPTIRFIADLGIPAPRALSTAAEVVINGNLRDAFEKDDLDMKRIKGLLNAARVDAVTLDPPTLAFALQGTIERLAERLLQDPDNIAAIQELLDAIELTRSLPFRVEIWKVQNGYYRLLQRVYQDFQTRAERGDEPAKEWVRLFTLLGEKLAVNVESVRQGLAPSS
jgi:alpha-amylase/alpha-mannosidase (GH57 family)